MKTDPRPYAFVFVGALILTLDAVFDGLKVLGVAGGTVSRTDAALAAGNTLATGDVLAVIPTTTGGTVTLNCQQDNQEFSGRFADLSGLSVDITTDPPKLKYTRSDNVEFELALTRVPDVSASYILTGGWSVSGDISSGVLWVYHEDLPSLDPNAGKSLVRAEIQGLPQIANWVAATTFEQIPQMQPYQFVGGPTTDPNQIDLYLALPTGVTPPSGLTATYVFRP